MVKTAVRLGTPDSELNNSLERMVEKVHVSKSKDQLYKWPNLRYFQFSNI
jgi:hypothetical protein